MDATRPAAAGPSASAHPASVTAPSAESHAHRSAKLPPPAATGGASVALAGSTQVVWTSSTMRATISNTIEPSTAKAARSETGAAAVGVLAAGAGRAVGHGDLA